MLRLFNSLPDGKPFVWLTTESNNWCYLDVPNLQNWAIEVVGTVRASSLNVRNQKVIDIYSQLAETTFPR